MQNQIFLYKAKDFNNNKNNEGNQIIHEKEGKINNINQLVLNKNKVNVNEINVSSQYISLESQLMKKIILKKQFITMKKQIIEKNIKKKKTSIKLIMPME